MADLLKTWSSLLKKQLQAISNFLTTNVAVVHTTAASALQDSPMVEDFLQKFNSVKNEITQAMDREFKAGSIDVETGIAMSASNHRILDDGHTISESMSRAFQIGEDHGRSDFESFVEWGRAYLSDLSSPAGMPAFGKLTDDIYVVLREKLGVSDENARDFVTVNGSEAATAVIGGTISAIALVYAWNTEDKESFSRAIASIGLTSAVFLNPVTAAIAIVGLAIGYNKMVCSKAVARGGFITGMGLVVSALIPGPLLLGLIPAIVVTIYLNRKIGKDTDILDEGKTWLKIVSSPKFRKILSDNFENLLASFAKIKTEKAA